MAAERFHQKLILPFVPNPFCYFEIAEGEIRFVRYWQTLFSPPIDQTTPRFEPKGFFGAFGYGDVTIADFTQSQLVEGVIAGSRLRDRIEELKKNAQEPAAEPQEEKPKGSLPKGVVFSRRVIALKPMHDIFDRALWEQHPRAGESPEWHVARGEWVGRGQALCSFHLATSAFGKKRLVTILSPASGLLLADGDPCNGVGASKDEWAFILVPEGEPPPLPAREIFGAICDFCSEHRRYLFPMPKNPQGPSALDDAKLTEIFRLQMESEATSWDVASVTRQKVDYTQHLQQLVARCPELNAPLRNVLSTGGSGSSSSERQEEFNANDDANAPFEHRPEQHEAAIDEARTRWNLAHGFTQEQVRSVYYKRVDRIHDMEIEQFNKDYELLMKAAS